MDIMHFLTETDFGRCVFTTLVSMIPIIELRGGIPFGVALGLPYQEAFVSAVIGNIIPAPFIIVYIRKIFMMMRRYMPRLNGVVDKMEKKAHLKGQKVSKYKYIGLWLFVAIPLPGTGAWTGCRLPGHAPAQGFPGGAAGCTDRRLYHDRPDPCGGQPVFLTP